MSIRRKSPAKLKAARTPKVIRTLKLQVSAPQPMTELSLEELLEIKPPSLKQDSAAQKSAETAERIEEAKTDLGNLENEIISALFPATGFPESVQKIAARLGMTEKEVQDVADNALRGLRGNSSSKHRLSTVWN